MIKLMRQEIRRIFKSKSLYITIGIGVFFTLWLLVDQLAETKETQELIEKYGTIKMGLYYPDSLYNHFIGLDYWHKQPQTLYMLFPLLASIPYASSYCSEKKSGYLKVMLTRIDRKVYYISKFISVFFSGFITIISILIISLIISMMFYPMLNPEPITSQFPVAIGNSIFKTLFIEHPMCYILLYIIIDSIFFGLTSLISLAISTITNRIFVATVSSTIVFYIFAFIMSSLKMYTHSPAVYLIPYQPFEGIKIHVIILHCLVILLLCGAQFIFKEAKKDVL